MYVLPNIFGVEQHKEQWKNTGAFNLMTCCSSMGLLILTGTGKNVCITKYLWRGAT